MNRIITKEQRRLNNNEIIRQQKLISDELFISLDDQERRRHECQCGGRFSYYNKPQHLRTEKHKNWQQKKEAELKCEH